MAPPGAEVHGGNMAVAQVIAAHSSKDHTFKLMYLLRCIHFCAVGDFKPRAEHISGHFNTSADTASCNHMQVFFQGVPQDLKDPIPTYFAQLPQQSIRP